MIPPACHGRHSSAEYCAECRTYDAVVHALEAAPRLVQAFESVAHAFAQLAAAAARAIERGQRL